MVHVGDADDDGDDRAHDTSQHGDGSAALRPPPPILLDRAADTGEQVRGGTGVRRRLPEHAGEPLLHMVHGAPPSVLSSADRPRLRWVLTELRDTPIVVAISSIPSSPQ